VGILEAYESYRWITYGGWRIADVDNSIGGENIEVEESNRWKNYGSGEIVEVEIINVEEL